MHGSYDMEYAFYQKSWSVTPNELELGVRDDDMAESTMLPQAPGNSSLIGLCLHYTINRHAIPRGLSYVLEVVLKFSRDLEIRPTSSNRVCLGRKE